jgi:outer membrane protein assembly factor BamB
MCAALVVSISIALAACSGGSSSPPPPSVDTVPDAFAFAPRSNVGAGATVESNAVVITGINAPAVVGVAGGEYAVNGGIYTSADSAVSNGASITVRLTANVQAGAIAVATLTIGGVSATFTVTTATSGDPLPLGSQDWPMFGHDFANTRASRDVTIASQHLPSLRLAQRIAGAGVASTPAVVDGAVYYSDFAGWLKAADAISGAEIWSTRLQTTMLSPSPFVAADTVYIAGDNSFVYAVNRQTGAVRWSSKIETSPNNRIWS